MIVQDENMVAAFVNTKELPEKKSMWKSIHLCYMTQLLWSEGVEYIRLYAVEREYYKHPDKEAAEYGILIPVLRINFVKEHRTDNPRAASIMLVHHAQTNQRNVVSLL